MVSIRPLILQTWDVYNAEESWLPWLVPLTIWTTAFLYCCLPNTSAAKKRPAFHEWQLLHNFHNVGAISLAVLSIYFDDDSILNERVPILWSLTYFAVDIVECLLRRDAEYLFHAVLGAILILFPYHRLPLRRRRFNSKVILVEVSNPFMHLAKRTRDPLHFVLFAVVFTMVRIAWIPCIMRQLVPELMEWTDPAFLCMLVFYGLNVFWWVKILRVLIRGLRGDARKKRDKTK